MITSITLMEAYLIETPQSKGMRPGKLLEHLRASNVEGLQKIDDEMAYEDLLVAYEVDPERITKAILTGYTIKFVSLYGIERLLRLKFNLVAGTDYTMHEDSIAGILLQKSELTILEEVLSPNWRVKYKKSANGRYKVDVLHQTVQ